MPSFDNAICTSGMIPTSTTVSHGFIVTRYSSPPFGSNRKHLHSEPCPGGFRTGDRFGKKHHIQHTPTQERHPLHLSPVPLSHGGRGSRPLCVCTRVPLILSRFFAFFPVFQSFFAFTSHRYHNLRSIASREEMAAPHTTAFYSNHGNALLALTVDSLVRVSRRVEDTFSNPNERILRVSCFSLSSSSSHHHTCTRVCACACACT